MKTGPEVVFRKKSKHGTSTDKADMRLIRERLKIAEKFAKDLRDE
jgi:hypothetical protein